MIGKTKTLQISSLLARKSFCEAFVKCLFSFGFFGSSPNLQSRNFQWISALNSLYIICSLDYSSVTPFIHWICCFLFAPGQTTTPLRTFPTCIYVSPLSFPLWEQIIFVFFSMLQLQAGQQKEAFFHVSQYIGCTQQTGINKSIGCISIPGMEQDNLFLSSRSPLMTSHCL